MILLGLVQVSIFCHINENPSETKLFKHQALNDLLLHLVY